MATKRKTTQPRVKQWHSWRPGWMSNTAILSFVLVLAIGVLLTSLNKDAVSGVASIFGAKAATFSCSGVSGASPATASGQVITSNAGANWAGPFGKCTKVWTAFVWPEYYNKSKNLWIQPKCVNGGLCQTRHGSYAANTYHGFTSKFTPDGLGSPCHYQWRYRFKFQDIGLFHTAGPFTVKNSGPSC